MGNGEAPSRIALSRQLGVSRTHLAQVLGLLDLATGALDKVLALTATPSAEGGLASILWVRWQACQWRSK